MSRIIVKNLPNQVTADKLRELFSGSGTVTDVQLKNNDKGKFRGFAFVGFQTDEQAQAASNSLHKTFINTKQITVEVCAALDKKPRPWGKHSLAEPEPPPSLQNKRVKKEKKGKLKSEQVVQLLEEHQGDALFQEFMETHLPSEKELWQKEKGEDEAEQETEVKEADAKISDLEYLKRKTKKSEENGEKDVIAPRQHDTDRFSVKLSNIACTAKKAAIKEFLKPAKTVSVRIPLKMKGIAYADFASVAEMKRALMKHRSFMGSRRIIVKPLDMEKKAEKIEISAKRKREEERLQSGVDQGETVSDSGRLFLRNLPYSATEDTLRPLLEKFGPVTELNMPIDPISRKPKGFAFVTFLIPEHACNALNQLDGTVVQGRMLHILPGLPKSEPDDTDLAGLNFKQKKLLKQKQMANNKVNWNTLFINDNCLAEAMASTFNTTKQMVLADGSGTGGAAVRLALGETDMVNKTKQFLVDNGVSLEAFNSNDSPRSDKVILVKNLPFSTEESELKEKFKGFGELSCVLLSPFGGTAIVEFIEPSEARKAFKRLAYSKFKHIPLYLEWAPKAIFEGRNQKKAEKIEEVKEVVVPVDGATLYVKGINFSTNADGLRKHFESCGTIASVIVAEKRDPNRPGQKLSMGYGFVEFTEASAVDDALKTLQFSSLDGHTIELKRSNRTTNQSTNNRARAAGKGQPSTKMVVRNLPFQATQNELRDLFKVFGEIKALRLPKKMVGTGSHRGFCFIEYHSKHDAKRAFEALSESTHLYGRRLVLEWAENDEDVEALRLKTAQHFNPSGKTEKKKNLGLDDAVAEEED